MFSEESYFEYLAFHVTTSFSKAIKNTDYDKLDYLPNQYICELIKKEGFDGIKYKSCMNKEDTAYNFLIFDEKKIEFIKTSLHKIYSTNCSYETEMINH